MDIPKEKLHELESFFKHIPNQTHGWYRGYWQKHTPLTSRERWQKWIFAAASIHTGWENNVAQYNALKDIKGTITVDEIATKITSGGMQHRKAKLIKEICDSKVYDFLPNANQEWNLWRDFQRENLWGIGNAKISFAAELMDPLNTTIICIDRHILDAFGQDKEKAASIDDYLEMEDIWIFLSNKEKIPPALARFIYWDCHIQQKNNCRYWSSVLES